MSGEGCVETLLGIHVVRSLLIKTEIPRQNNFKTGLTLVYIHTKLGLSTSVNVDCVETLHWISFEITVIIVAVTKNRYSLSEC